MSRPLFLYSITVSGYDPVHVQAETASKARYAVFRKWRDAGLGDRDGRRAFREFLCRITTLHFGRIT